MQAQNCRQSASTTSRDLEKRAQSFYDVDLMEKAIKKATKRLSIPKTQTIVHAREKIH
jgi:hypothetical protein